MPHQSLLFLLMAFMIGEVKAELRVARVFNDGVVLQREMPVKIWGWADPGQSVNVRFAGQAVEAETADSGAWQVTFEPLVASAEAGELMVKTGDEQRTIRNVLVGDVWHASGQSNMAMTMESAAKRLNAVADHIANAELPEIRFCRLREGASKTLQDENGTVSWAPITPATVPKVSAVAFYFAKKLHGELNVPVGILDSSRGGTPIEPYIPTTAFVDHPVLLRERELGEADDLEAMARLPGGVRARDAHWLPGRLFNSRIAPLRNLAVKGVIWYQGESNSGVMEDPRDYRHKMRALISGWRVAFQQSDLPFYYVQLPGSGAGAGWPFLREEQRLANTLPRSGMAVIIDLLENDIHPANKIDVGARLARLALSQTYARALAPSGPLFEKVVIDGSRAIVHFKYVEGGLRLAVKRGIAPPVVESGLILGHVELAGNDRVWKPAKARLEGEMLVAESEAVPVPVAVRYAYEMAPEHCYLYNDAGLPASPFCSHPEWLAYDPGLPKE